MISAVQTSMFANSTENNGEENDREQQNQRNDRPNDVMVGETHRGEKNLQRFGKKVLRRGIFRYFGIALRSEEILRAETSETGHLIDAGAVVSARIQLAFVHFRCTTFAVVTRSSTVAAKASLVVRLTRSVVLTRHRTAG